MPNPLMRHLINWSVPILLSFSLTVGTQSLLHAQGTNTPPAEIQALIRQIDSVASQKDADKVLQFYSPNFTTSDGLTYKDLPAALEVFWSHYDQVQYNTSIESWKKQGDKTIVNTVTTVTGTGKMKGRVVNLNAKIRSTQEFKDNKIIYQDIQTERVDITSGKKIPRYEVRLPDKVKVNQEFDFDVIVKDPLGDDLLAGVALDEKIEPSRYLDPKSPELEILNTGGIFKRVKAPNIPQDRWLSAILVQGDGLVLITQRVQVVPEK
jgi:hypothetical protein